MGLQSSFSCSLAITTMSENFHSFMVLRIKHRFIWVIWLPNLFGLEKMNCLLKGLHLIRFGVTSSEFLLKFCLATLCLGFLYFLASFVIQGARMTSPLWANHRFQSSCEGKQERRLHLFGEGEGNRQWCLLASWNVKKIVCTLFWSHCFLRFWPFPRQIILLSFTWTAYTILHNLEIFHSTHFCTLT